jgi:hypothetical protein
LVYCSPDGDKVFPTGKTERNRNMKTNLKTLALALVAGLTFAVCAEKPACESMMGEPAPAAETATAEQPAPAPEKQAKPRRTRRAKKDKVTAPADGKQKPVRRRRMRKMDTAEIPVTGMLDSAE